jgi:hypothetical protein
MLLCTSLGVFFYGLGILELGFRVSVLGCRVCVVAFRVVQRFRIWHCCARV